MKNGKKRVVIGLYQFSSRKIFKGQKTGSSRFGVGWKRDKPYKGKEVTIVSVAVGNPLGNLNFVIHPFKFSGGDGMFRMGDKPLQTKFFCFSKSVQMFNFRSLACFKP